MRLADFIRANVEPILVEWVAFARTIWPPGTPADPVEMRDSAEQILRAVVADMATPQSAHQQSEKSAGRGGHGAESDRLDHASQVHGAARVGSGLALPAVVAEYRALRASVLRLWRQTRPNPDAHDLDDLTRFNEAIDQSLALAVESFTHRVDKARNLFLGVLGHDLRNPLSAILLTAKVAATNLLDPAGLSQSLSQITASAEAIARLVTDLIDFARSSMGVGLPLAPAPADLRGVCGDVVREVRAAHPGRTVRLDARGDLAGTWDAHRLRQVITNLLTNALQHGAPADPVSLAADGADARFVVLSVHNTGVPIPPDVLPTLFDPLVRGPDADRQRRAPGSIGLGLYIVREIAAAHGGFADLASTAEAGTTATVRLPRHAGKGEGSRQ